MQVVSHLGTERLQPVRGGSRLHAGLRRRSGPRSRAAADLLFAARSAVLTEAPRVAHEARSAAETQQRAREHCRDDRRRSRCRREPRCYSMTVAVRRRGDPQGDESASARGQPHLPLGSEPSPHWGGAPAAVVARCRASQALTPRRAGPRRCWWAQPLRLVPERAACFRRVDRGQRHAYGRSVAARIDRAARSSIRARDHNLASTPDDRVAPTSP